MALLEAFNYTSSELTMPRTRTKKRGHVFHALTTPVTNTEMSEYLSKLCCCCRCVRHKRNRKKQHRVVEVEIDNKEEETTTDVTGATSVREILLQTREQNYGAISSSAIRVDQGTRQVKQNGVLPSGYGSSSSMLSTVEESTSDDGDSSTSSSSSDASGSDHYSTVTSTSSMRTDLTPVSWGECPKSKYFYKRVHDGREHYHFHDLPGPKSDTTE